ncbi:hypothetical protein IB270_07640 [Ensifer sp. ENS05]|uniref:hypothetical protein n=1 Tax=Ensifer sp. ENS05 TaxID=2769277 RepID=UPI00178392D7|nr:hypothetical protein [Ensifer sp. ENS05]MBD9592701.1 hypothetical protein [Ensifer sp. ENS05]
MADDDLTDEQIRQMERKLLGYEAPPKTAVEVRRRRLPRATGRPKPRIEVKPRFSAEVWDWLYDFFIVSERGRHLVRPGVYADEARKAVKEYQREGTEVRVVK